MLLYGIDIMFCEVGGYSFCVSCYIEQIENVCVLANKNYKLLMIVIRINLKVI